MWRVAELLRAKNKQNIINSTVNCNRSKGGGAEGGKGKGGAGYMQQATDCVYYKKNLERQHKKHLGHERLFWRSMDITKFLMEMSNFGIAQQHNF